MQLCGTKMGGTAALGCADVTAFLSWITHFMMKPFFYFLLVLTLYVVCPNASAKDLPAFAHSTQMVVVTTADWNSPSGTLQRYERESPGQKWKAVGEPIPVMVGKTGLAWGSGLLKPSTQAAADPVKKEGDGKAPAGVFRVSKAFGYAQQEQPGWKMPYIALTPSIQCVDDTNSKFYNTLVDANTISPDWGNHENEQMRRSDDLYRWGILVDHNASPAAPGAGSCIFMHIWRGPGQPTVGCTAMAQQNLESLLSWLDPARQPLLIQMPAAQYEHLHKKWHLPAVSAAQNANGSTMQSGANSIGK
jgi:L,D-peptidoglycan transpeptidase YkuD (ErfK/YbiS/YcfS/YnhG family)